MRILQKLSRSFKLLILRHFNKKNITLFSKFKTSYLWRNTERQLSILLRDAERPHLDYRLDQNGYIYTTFLVWPKPKFLPLQLVQIPVKDLKKNED